MEGNKPNGSTYQAYLLRLWLEQPAKGDQPAIWRCSLDDTANGQRVGFASLTALMEYLNTRLIEESTPKLAVEGLIEVNG